MNGCLDTTVLVSVCVRVCVLATQSCLTLWDRTDSNPPGFSRHEYWSGLFSLLRHF